MLQFTKLRLSGFKSFVDPTELMISAGLTGIVGPNGCGKSNLVEALRWVMGETSARQLRGGEMDDVIFAGSAERPGRSFAEVVVELQNGTRAAPAPFSDADELHVSRRIERDRGSLYRVNGREVRARDVQMLFADASSGARSAAMVTQGQVSQLIAAKPAERRTILEEAAGIVGLHSRRHEAETRFQSAEGNLQRLDDVLGTLEKQLHQLRRQGKQAQRYRQLSTQIRTLEASLAWTKWQTARAAVETAREALATAESTLARLTAEAAAAATRRTEAAAALPPLRTEASEAAADLQRLSAERDRVEAEEQQLARDTDTCRRQLQQLAAALERERALDRDAESTVRGIAEERARLQALQAREGEQIAAAEAALAEAASAVKALEADALTLTGQLSALQARRTALERENADAQRAVARLQGRRLDLGQQRTAVLAEAAALPDPDHAQAALTEAETALAEARTRLEDAEATRARLAAEETQTRAQLRQAEEPAARLRAEQQALAALVRRTAAAAGPGIVDKVRVAAEHRLAFAAAFGDDLLAGEDDQASAHWRDLPAYTAAPGMPDGAACLHDAVETPPALARRLALTGVVACHADGDRLQEALAPGQRLVDRDGNLWRWDGFRRKAGAPPAAAIHLQHAARLEELEGLLAEAEAARRAAAERHTASERHAREAAEAERRARDALRPAEATLARSREAVSALAARRTKVDARLASLDGALAPVEAEHAEAETRAAAVAAALAALPAAGNDERALAAVRAKLEQARPAHLDRRTRLDSLQRDSAGRRRRLQSLEADAASWAERQDSVRRQIDALDAQKADADATMATLQAAPAELAARRHDILERLGAADQRSRIATDRVTCADAAQAEADRLGTAADRAEAGAREQRVRAEAADQHAREADEAARAMIRERFEVPPERLPEATGIHPAGIDGDPAEAERRLDKLRRDREQMGPVNLRADTEATAIETQVGDLVSQREDLVEAIARLRRGVAELDREGRDRLRAAFTEVDGHFRTLFSRLFGGGRAMLSLTDHDDPLQAGLEIMASPPGKKLQLMSLLSGGEQTLTALALRFALFLIRPAPICVLDEVDAALDDANVGRLCGLLEDLSAGGTRFLVITHHRLTMARMHRLYGVTMIERGTSRLVSVDLQRAELLRQTA